MPAGRTQLQTQFSPGPGLEPIHCHGHEYRGQRTRWKSCLQVLVRYPSQWHDLEDYIFTTITRRSSVESRAREKMNKSPCSSHCGLAAMQRGHRHRLHRRYCCLFKSPRPIGIISRQPSLGCCPGGKLPSGHARRYSSCHYPQANLLKRKVVTQTHGPREKKYEG